MGEGCGEDEQVVPSSVAIAGMYPPSLLPPLPVQMHLHSHAYIPTSGGQQDVTHLACERYIELHTTTQKN